MSDHVRDPLRPTVCHVLHSLHFGGAEVLARRFAVRLQSEFRPVFACLDGLGPIGEQLKGEGVPVCVLQRRPGFDLRCVWRLSRWLRKQRVDLIHAHQYAPFLYSSLARRIACRVPVLFTEHGRDFPDYRRWKRVLANRYLLRRFDHVVAVGEHVRQALINNEGLPRERIEVIYNGVDTASFERPISERTAIRKELGYADDDFVVIKVARLNRLKDHATAIRVTAQLSKSHPNLRLLLIGDGEEREQLEALVGSLGVQPIVRFLGARGDVPRLLHAADLFLLTSVSEGIPLTLVEAMLARVPVVATRVGGVPEVVVAEQSGLLAEAGDVSGLALHIERLLRDPQLRQRLTAASFRRACERFSAQEMLRTYQCRYLSLLARSSLAPRRVCDAKGGMELAAFSGSTLINDK
jgi:N-acetyl-alpha-D-glucosaminyl L-malate synthase BshA